MQRYTALLALLVFLGNNDYIFCQSGGVNRDKYRIGIARTSENIIIDGILDEAVWGKAERTGVFQRVTPTDTGFAIAQTVVMMTYDDLNLYLGVICLDPTPGKRPVESLRRDFNFSRNDNFMVFLDTYNDQTNGFAFGISASGAQTEGLQYEGTRVNYSWDIKWRSSVASYDDRWVIEISIPFRSLRYNEGDREWGVNFGRLDLKNNEKSAWAPMPRQFPHCSLPYTGTMMWDEPLGKAGLRFSLIPYLTAKSTRDYEASDKFTWKGNAGLDAKVILSTSMNLDLTVNPDYSQVEVDRQQTNLDRFELFFPEKRQFFLENSDLFASLGTQTIRPFFSRRIGLNSPVLAGARLSGNIGSNWRVNVMDIQTGSRDDLRASNFFVAALQRSVFSRSNISAFIINRQVTENVDTEEAFPGNSRFNRVAGLEYNLATADNRWTGKAFYHQSFQEGASLQDAAMAANITYSSRFLTASLNQSLVGSGYVADVGYVRRTGYYELNPVIRYKFFPRADAVISHGPGIRADMFFDTSTDLTDRQTEISYSVEWSNLFTTSLEASETYIKLMAPYDPTNTGGEKLPAGDAFGWREVGASFASDMRKPFYLSAKSSYGGYYNGERWSVSGELNYRYQPYGSLALVMAYNNISLPEPYNSAKLVLIGPRLDFTFTDNIFFTSFIQYNNQIDNLNLNLRLQWRFAPVSDLFIVYTENSFPAAYNIKNRGLVIKLSYWFN
ncbi:MAG: carbohydrate binding family 9 domain-containing protein [Bacteroidales bacterium]|nr:carbohydrate binding family 9 domain-containing protein [Bacteroidales bacterium]